MNFGKTIRKFRRNTRAISPVIATLLMIAIAVVASLVTYAWVMGYMNFTTNKTGQAIQVQSVSYATGQFTVYVQNVGDSDVRFASPGTLGAVYINNGAATVVSIKDNTADITTLPNEHTATIVVTAPTALVGTGVQSVTIKVATVDGTFAQVTQQFTL